MTATTMLFYDMALLVTYCMAFGHSVKIFFSPLNILLVTSFILNAIAHHWIGDDFTNNFTNDFTKLVFISKMCYVSAFIIDPIFVITNTLLCMGTYFIIIVLACLGEEFYNIVTF